MQLLLSRQPLSPRLLHIEHEPEPALDLLLLTQGSYHLVKAHQIVANAEGVHGPDVTWFMQLGMTSATKPVLTLEYVKSGLSDVT